mmetsp:Transcript_58318/g.131334  ORF Transcript_58318/g.131334 Transcript_58318/m.131334 type:complete len:148 (+) Transcript_58318:137-580(+)
MAAMSSEAAMSREAAEQSSTDTEEGLICPRGEAREFGRMEICPGARRAHPRFHRAVLFAAAALALGGAAVVAWVGDPWHGPERPGKPLPPPHQRQLIIGHPPEHIRTQPPTVAPSTTSQRPRGHGRGGEEDVEEDDKRRPSISVGTV